VVIRVAGFFDSRSKANQGRPRWRLRKYRGKARTTTTLGQYDEARAKLCAVDAFVAEQKKEWAKIRTEKHEAENAFRESIRDISGSRLLRKMQGEHGG
jgi:hypothetical protein